MMTTAREPTPLDRAETALSPQDILALLRATPFQPFRIVMNSGRRYDVRHPELLNVTFTTAVVFIADNGQPPADRFEIISLALIERIEFLEAAAAK